ncbi:AAA family ATPase [Ruegeria sp. PrR005]|uniref:ATP-binding protein n=1 Tax=Ruegeria sp. PrR005 TaxID=2706882 RepID=A0A6B2NWS6_9RHOB|nr:AAA family ATPase [Ruegeria sp. PrR005]NDW46355.1 ATP-binding protein [Ruegeria sp. PrR005]
MTVPETLQEQFSDLLRRAIGYVRSGDGLEDHITNIVGLDLPIDGEGNEIVAQTRHIVELIEGYHADSKAERPLSIVVFGPPGSGKSTFVRRISKAVTGCKLVKTANLTQIAGTDELAKTFEAALQPKPAAEVDEKEGTITPVFFFDEFDAALDGAALGWLRWFLAPMQDGVVLVDGKELEVRKAVFIFAGGTAETLDEFNRRAQFNAETYRARKVPDFISRLRGAINIGGVNGLGDVRIVPRALVLRRILETRSVSLNDDQLSQLLSNGHFVHGVRSMMTLLDAGWNEEGQLNLPKAIQQQHFSRGKLDGQLVGISAGLKEAGSAPVFSTLTKQLLRNGAALAYAGAFEPKGTLEHVIAADRDAPPELAQQALQKPRVRNYLGYPASLRAETAGTKTDTNSIEFIPLNTISTHELKELGAPTDEWFGAMPTDRGETYDPRRHVAWALSLFRLRVRMLQDVSALVVLGGKDDGQSWGRMAGIAEEVMIAIALRTPVFVLGGAGGAARAVGQILGLDEATVGLERCLMPVKHTSLCHALAPYSNSFEVPGEPNTPRDLDALRHFLFHRGVTTAAWPWNGLSLGENRELFACEVSQGGRAVERAVELIVQGLTRIDLKSGVIGRYAQ